MRRLRRIGAILIALLAVTALARAGELSDDLSARRARFMARLGSDTMVVMWSAPTRRYSRDVDYEYRQDSNFYYLTGITQDGSILVLMPGNAAHRQLLFVKDRDPVQEHWHGRLLTLEQAKVDAGVDDVLPISQFEPFMSGVLGRTGFGPLAAADAAAFMDALSANRASLSIVVESDQESTAQPDGPGQIVHKWQERFAGLRSVNVRSTLEDLRLVKTPYERKILVKSLDISNDAQLAGMRAARPGIHEYEVKAAIEAVHRARGAASWAYPSIVGSGPNATILHYPDGDRRMRAGELLLVDAACNFEYMSGDITRTYPVDGTFTALQKDVYEIVLQAQEEGIKAARPGATLQAIHAKTVEVIKTSLLRLGLIADASGDQYRMWYTHSASHYIGIDVHDVGDRQRALVPGTAFTIEPGIYVRQAPLDALPRTPENLALIEKIQPAVRKYAGIGVRIEDSFLLEEEGLRNLSAAVPKTVGAIEAFMHDRRAER
jgi:Xaa-Pro aminopeptidase